MDIFRSYFKKHDLYKLTEIKSVRPYYIAKLETLDNVSCFFEKDNHLQNLLEKRKKVFEEIKKNLNQDDFLLLTFCNTNIMIYDTDLLVNVYLEKHQEIQLVDRFGLFKEEMRNGCCGLLIVFKNQSEQGLATISNLFGTWL